MQTQRFAIQGASCQGCVRKIRQSLGALPGIDDVQVDLDTQLVTVTGNADSAAVQAALSRAGYASDTPPQEAPHSPASRDHEQQLAITGATCAACVRTIENALRHTPGVTRAQMNFADRTARVSGTADTQSLIDAVERAGYGASPVNDNDEDGAREQQEQQHYRQLLRHMWLGLGLGVPLMAWGLLGGDMMVRPGQTSQWAWLGIGLMTLAVLATAGRHFFVGAWKAFRNHNANKIGRAHV